jgi:acetylornithine deacetylase/succinyl-diaminopimelate desuccinylase-like protein
MDGELRTQLMKAIDRNLERSLSELSELVGQPSISSQGVGMDAAAELVADLLRRHDLSSRLIETPSYPVVYGEWKGGGPGSLVLYNHYDVQPADPLDLWNSPPFEVTRVDGKLVGRGIADDKGHIISRLAALDAVREVLGDLPCTVKLMIEGGEEISSPHIPEFVQEHRDLLAADACIWETGGVDFSGRPVITLGMRGICYLQYDVRTMSRDAHSGMAHLLPNAAWRLVQALGTLKDPEGHIAVEGFFDDALKPTERDLQLISELPNADEDMYASYGISEFINGLSGDAAERAVYSPTANIAGFSSGYQGAGAKTVIPSSAMAKMDFRLIPDQDPEDIYRKVCSHLEREGFGDVEVTYLGGERAAATDPDEPWVLLAIDTAREVYGKEPIVFPMIGGSGPMHPFRHTLGVPIVTSGVGDPETLIHAPNENIRIENFVLGTLHTALLVARYAQGRAAAT